MINQNINIFYNRLKQLSTKDETAGKDFFLHSMYLPNPSATGKMGQKVNF